MSDDFYTFVDSGDPAPDNAHLNGVAEEPKAEVNDSDDSPAEAKRAMYAARIAVYDDMLSTPRVIVIEPQDVRTYLEETTNTVYRCMKEQGGKLSLMVIREIVENFIHAHFAEPIISILDGGNTIRFADQGPGIEDKERAFDFGVTSANRDMKRYIRGTGAGFPMVQEYLENAGGAVSIEDNMGAGTVVTVSLDPKRVAEIERAGGRGAAVRPENEMDPYAAQMMPGAQNQMQNSWQMQQGIPAQPVWNAGAGAPSATDIPNVAMQGATGVPQTQPQGLAAAGGEGAIQTQQQMAQATMQQPTTMPKAQTQAAVQPQNMPQGYMQSGAYPMQQSAGAYPAYRPMGYPQQYQQAYPQAYRQPYGQVAPQMTAQGYQPWPQGYQQPMAPMYGSFQQPAAQMVYANQANQVGQPPQEGPYLNEREGQILQYLMGNRECGPTELARAYGSSAPTWSRELIKLAEAGLVIKSGQKFHLTEMGRAHMAQNPQQ